MSTVYSLVCWGGLTGKTVTPSFSTSSFTLTNHGNRDGSKRYFDPTGNVPAGLSYGTPYYVKKLTDNTFQLYLDQGLTTLATFTSNPTSVRLLSDWVVESSKLTPYNVDSSRYGSRIYDGFNSARSARNSGLTTDDEVIEFAEAFDEITTVQQIIGTFGLSLTFTTSINGKRTPAFHYGVIGSGYIYLTTAVGCFYTTQENVTIDGFEFRRNSTNASTTNTIAGANYPKNVIKNCIFQNLNPVGWTHGLLAQSSSEVFNNLIVGVSPGRTDVAGLCVTGGATAYNNTVVKCGLGLISYSTSSSYANVYNNLIVGNEINYGRQTTFVSNRFDGNIGETRDLVEFTVSVGGTSATLVSATQLVANAQVFLSSTGELPSVGGVPLSSDRSYYVRSVTGNVITLGLVYNGAALTFSSAGTGVHKLSLVWSTTSQPSNYIDMSDPNLVFKDWANNDFRPAGTGAVPASQAKMVDTSILKRGLTPDEDITGKPRPAYNNGGPEGIDVGAFEFDPGYGLRPASFSLTLTNVVVGSRVVVRDVSDTVTHYNQIATTNSVVIVVPVYGDSRDNWIIKVRKGTELPYYRPWDTLVTAVEGSQSIYVSQIPD